MACQRNIHNNHSEPRNITVASLLSKPEIHTCTILNKTCVISDVETDTTSALPCDTPNPSYQSENGYDCKLENSQVHYVANESFRCMSTGHEQSRTPSEVEPAQIAESAVVRLGTEKEPPNLERKTFVSDIEAPGILRLLLPSGKIRMLQLKGEAKFRVTHSTTERFKSHTRYILVLLKFCMDGICQPEDFANRNYMEELLSYATDLSITSQKSLKRDNMPSMNNLLDILTSPNRVHQYERESTEEARNDYARRIGRLYRYSVSEDLFKAIHPDDLEIIKDYIQVDKKSFDGSERKREARTSSEACCLKPNFLC